VRALLARGNERVVNVDKLTYAGNLDSLRSVHGSPNHIFARVDVGDAVAIRQLFADHRPRSVVHLAAESHVDRSIDGPAEFIQTNIVGTFILLEEARRYWMGLADDERRPFRFLHVSTDEVFGSSPADDLFNETTPYLPRSPYAASKASSDHRARAWHETYGLPVLITNCSNNYGPYQFPEKLIPLTILNALEREPVHVYGNGENVRDWLHVEDHADAILTVLRDGQIGETYLVGARNQRRIIDVVRLVCSFVDELAPHSTGLLCESLVEFVPDRPGHDLRYAIDPSKIETFLGWSPSHKFEVGLRRTVAWYLENRTWWERIRSGLYRGERIGLLRTDH
jgi:dTDP-glucose 4,6-dehydratase